MTELKSIPLEDRVCSECGSRWEKNSRLTVTGCGKVLCHTCEEACKNYRRYMLPNGTHCTAAFESEYFRYRLLMMQIPAPPSKVKAARGKYEKTLSGELFEELARQVRKYRAIQEAEASANARVELEAIRQVLYDRVQSDKLQQHLFNIFKEIAEGKRQYVKG